MLSDGWVQGCRPTFLKPSIRPYTLKQSVKPNAAITKGNQGLVLEQTAPIDKPGNKSELIPWQKLKRESNNHERD